MTFAAFVITMNTTITRLCAAKKAPFGLIELREEYEIHRWTSCVGGGQPFGVLGIGGTLMFNITQ